MAAITTYRELFQASLEEQIAAGGEVSRMVMLVNAYQGTDRTTWSREFRDWLQGSVLACGRCQTGFSPSVEDVQEEDDVLCVWCRRGSLGLGLEPVPGWKRTWGRW